MNEPMDLIRDAEEAITDLQVMIDARRPGPLLSEIQRLDRRLRLIHASEPIFSRETAQRRFPNLRVSAASGRRKLALDHSGLQLPHRSDFGPQGSLAAWRN